ncbi:MAG: hypothetical protein KJO94_07925, partial [Eudoraea sp.]|nr:hypothetical protein [Eudoraea sp.]
SIYRVNLIEKILATLLAKISNFIPEGGIWMNTQRPEWNDANNALVGNGVSMVTLYYLRRFLNFLKDLLSRTGAGKVVVSRELLEFFKGVLKTFEEHRSLLGGTINDTDRKRILDGLGLAGSDFRQGIYEDAFSGNKDELSLQDLQKFIALGLEYCEHAIRANRREDQLYHAYNLMTVENKDEVSISYLSEMLEGQVAVLSSGYLSSRESLDLLDGLKASDLFRPDQYSYLLYPNKDLPLFAEKNNIPEKEVSQSKLLSELVEKENTQIIVKDINGVFHFNGNFKNASDLSEALNDLDPGIYSSLSEDQKRKVLKVFELVFNHKAFTGRSGTFFGYEGLGSIYWHMVSKLLLAVQEVCLKAVSEEADPETVGRLLEHYYEINAGIGVHKSPALYGAFPTDPYSHTPQGKGAQQPGMTGQVKEDILSRFGELGAFVREGRLCFDPCLLRKDEFLTEVKTFAYTDLSNTHKQLDLEPGSLAFTYCQVPVVYQLADLEGMEITFSDGSKAARETHELDAEISRKVFDRTGEVAMIKLHLKEGGLR